MCFYVILFIKIILETDSRFMFFLGKKSSSGRNLCKAFLALWVVLFVSSVNAREMPYFASIKTDEANIRSGPSVRYPIQWLYKRKNWPVKVTATFEMWRKIDDANGEIGWIHESLLSSKRYALVRTDGVQEVYKLPIATANKVFIVENGVIAEIKECKEGWCKISVERNNGWIKSEHIWGVNKGEIIE